MLMSARVLVLCLKAACVLAHKLGLQHETTSCCVDDYEESSVQPGLLFVGYFAKGVSHTR